MEALLEDLTGRGVAGLLPRVLQGFRTLLQCMESLNDFSDPDAALVAVLTGTSADVLLHVCQPPFGGGGWGVE